MQNDTGHPRQDPKGFGVSQVGNIGDESDHAVNQSRKIGRNPAGLSGAGCVSEAESRRVTPSPAAQSSYALLAGRTLRPAVFAT